MPEAMVVGLAETSRRRLRAFGGRTDRPSKRADYRCGGRGPGMKSRRCASSPPALLAGIADRSRSTRRCCTPCRRSRRAARRRATPILLPHAGELAALLECERGGGRADPVGCGLNAPPAYRALVAGQGRRQPCRPPRRPAWTYQGGAPGPRRVRQRRRPGRHRRRPARPRRRAAQRCCGRSGCTARRARRCRARSAGSASSPAKSRTKSRPCCRLGLARRVCRPARRRSAGRHG